MLDYASIAKENARKDAEAYLKEVCDVLPWHFRKWTSLEYWRLNKRDGSRTANLYLTDLKENAKNIKFRLALDDDELCDRADYFANTCEKILSKNGGDLETSFSLMSDYAKNVGAVEPPDIEEFGEYGAVRRLTDAGWWRRALRKVHARGLERLAIDANFVNVKRGIYCSDDTVKRRREQKGRNKRILEEVKAINEENQEYTLQELSELGVSNPKIRRMELMTRIAGFEAIAKEQNLSGEFYTLTAPSKYHASLSKSGQRNPKFKNYTPRETQTYLNKVWAKARAEFKRNNLAPFGFRVVEPHHDGTPHWHLLLFIEKEQVSLMRSIMLHYALLEDGQEQGARKQRFKAVAIDPNKGTAAGYIAKYIAKAIDGYGVDYDLYGVDAIKASERIEAWASTWGIRQFQQIGGASVTVWRELRRMESEQMSDLLEQARQAADRGDWAEYCRLNSNKQIQLMREVVEDFGKYGDMKGEPILGLMCGKVAVITRTHQWQVGVNATATAGANSDSDAVADPWSSVNNCTEQSVNYSEIRMIQDAAFREYKNYQASGEVWEGGFNEFYDEWLFEKGYL